MFNRPKEFDPALSTKTLSGIQAAEGVPPSDLPSIIIRTPVNRVTPSSPSTIRPDLTHVNRCSALNADELQTVNSRLQSAIQSFCAQPKRDLLSDTVSIRSRFDIDPRVAHSKLIANIAELRSSQNAVRESVVDLMADFQEMKMELSHQLAPVLQRQYQRPGASLVPAAVANLRTGLQSLRDIVYSLRDYIHASVEDMSMNLVKGFSRLLCAETDALREKLRVETALRRKLHNAVLELKGNIRVFLRVRPLLDSEIADGTRACVLADSDTEVRINKAGQVRTFTFDRVFDSTTNNAELFAELHQLLISTLDGFNVAIIAYGITGSGKTYTMQGIYERLGLDLFHEKASRESNGGSTYAFEATVFEVYNESVIDLLNLKNLDCTLRTNPSTGFFHVPGLTRVKVEGPGDISKLLGTATKNRAVSSTNCNESSSRSHLVTTLHLAITTPSLKKIEAKMNLVDLAGSERLDKSGATGSVAKEGMFINKSLSALGDVINARVAKAAHVPYRNSVLTSALQDCIAGESKTLMILQVNPSEQSAEETMNSMVFASRVRDVESPKGSQSPRRRI